MLSTKIDTGTVYGGEQCIDITPKFPYKPVMGGVSYIHGAGSQADYCISATGRQGERTLKVSSKYPGIAGDNGGSATWGNDLSITRLGGYLSRLSARPDVSEDYALIGDSMGGIVALNYAAQANVKPKAIVLVIPVINIEDIRANNRAGYAAAINAAYGGAYNESTMGATKNPYTMRSAAKLMGIPTLIFYGLNDTLCLPSWATAYIAADPTKRQGVALPFGHEMGAYENVDHDLVLSFISQYLP